MHSFILTIIHLFQRHDIDALQKGCLKEGEALTKGALTKGALTGEMPLLGKCRHSVLVSIVVY